MRIFLLIIFLILTNCTIANVVPLVIEDSNNKNSILKSYDLLLNQKYEVVLNNKTIERVKNFFQ